jgi:hypothetical protein
MLTLGRLTQARALMASVLTATTELGERRSRAHYLDSMAMIALAGGDLPAAGEYLAGAAEMAVEIQAGALLAEIGIHRALAALAAGDRGGARQHEEEAGRAIAGPDCAQNPRLRLEYLALGACLALADGNTADASRLAGLMADRAGAGGYVLAARTAQRIAAAATAAQAGTEPAPAGYPRLLWVAREA